MSTLPTSLIAILTGFTTALFYAVPGAFGLDNGSSGVKVAPLASGGNKPRVPKRDNISQKARDLIPFKKLIARGPDNSDPTKQSQNGGDKSQRINIDSSSYSDKTTPDFDIQPPGEGKVNLRAPISLDKPEENNENAENKDQSSTKSNQPSTLKPMGVIRFDDDRRADRKHLKGGLSIFSCLDEALVKSPRAAAMRAYLPVTKALFARATEQPSPQFFYDEGVRAEQNRRLGAVFNWEPPWKLVFRLLVAKQSVSARKLELMAQLWLLRADVRRAYTEVVVAQETLETLTSLYDLAHRLRVVSEKRFAAGDVPELDLLKARLAESRYDVERRVGLRRVIRAKQQLNIIMGRAPEKDISIPRLPPFLRTKDMKGAADVRNPLLPDFSRPMPTLDSFIARAVENRYELKTINQNLVLNKANMRKTIGDIAPTPQFWIGQSAAGNPPVGPKLNAYYVGVSVPTQITSFNQGDIAEFKAQGRQLKYEYGAQKNIITAEVSSAYNNVLAARQWLKVYEDHVLADSYEVARLARRSYEVGQADITSTLQAQQNNVQIRSLYLEAITLYQKAFTELEMACGTPLLEED
ncbi:MAG: TolC family protein [Cyanobacteriota/Melainabacteria group bacterium]